ncbi:serine hydrolase [Alteraurantiacibacter aestuarii]|uniref:serine hydrolase n=1 Tax=Alteraurantiacibacter aestuarii TaxID=650004 RepID=UPI0031E253B3
MFRKIILAIALVILPSTASAQDNPDANAARLEQRASDVVAALNEDLPLADVFAPSFLAQVPEAQLRTMTQQMNGQFGALQGVESVTPTGTTGGAEIALRFERMIGHGQMQLENSEPFRVAGLLLNRFEPVNAEGLSPAEQLAALPGTTNMLLARLDGSEVLAAHNADHPLALGSAFKLYVLSALSRSIAAGERDWADIVELSERSFPSGQLQEWPRGSPVTLHTLATMMISISDNTATDQLITVLGRDAVEAELVASGNSDPALSLPFMKTRELFMMKLVDDAALEQYSSAGAAERLAVLQTLEGRDAPVSDIQRVFSAGPRFINIEWFASPHDIARIFARLADDEVALGILGVNKGMAQDNFAGWDYVGFKGGSEPGVLNLSWLLRSQAGEFWVLTLGWNNPDEPVSELNLIALAQAILSENRPES